MGTYGGLWGPIGPYGDLWGPMGTFEDPLAPMGTYGDLSGPMGAYGDLWGPIGPYGDLWGPIGAFGVGGINFVHTQLDTNPPPFLQASDLYQTYHKSCCIHCKNNMPHQTSDFIHNPTMALSELFSCA